MTDETRQSPGDTVSPGAPAHFDLEQLSAVLMDRTKIPVGFFVSTVLWTALAERFRYESGDKRPPIPVSFNGIKIEIDPNLPDTEFDVAFTEEAWLVLLAVIKQLSRSQRPEGARAMMHPDPIAYPPRSMDREEAARYVGAGVTKFAQMVSDGRMPRPKKVDGRVLWTGSGWTRPSRIYRRSAPSTRWTGFLSAARPPAGANVRQPVENIRATARRTGSLRD